MIFFIKKSNISTLFLVKILFWFSQIIFTFAPHKKKGLLNDLRRYNVAFSGLKMGIHQFDYQVDGAFFEHFEESDIDDAKLNVQVELEKQETMLILHFNITGNIKTTCDRCLESCTLEIAKETTLIAKFGDKYEEVSDEIIFIPRSANSLDISQYIYEFTMLALPIQRIHQTIGSIDGCNEKMISYLTETNESDHHKIDPRWEILNELHN